jgi:hypothetical protein
MIATIILSLLIFGFAAWLLVRRIRKGSSCDCGDCGTACPVKDAVK